jgi:hypothetical protein
MLRAFLLAFVILAVPQVDVVHAQGVLHITVPVGGHRLQISDNPASAPPKRIITSPEGVVDVRLAPGNYTVESERPVTIDGTSYQWTMVVDIVAGRDAVLALTLGNAEVVATPAPTPALPIEPDASSLLAQWQDSVVAIWTATSRGSGFLIDANGLIATDQHVIGMASSVEVQLSASVKVTGAVIVSDVMREIALVRIHPSIVASAKVLPIVCGETQEPVTVDQEITALEAPLSRLRGTSDGVVESVLANVIETDLESSAGGSGGPAFAPNGRLIGLTTLMPGPDDRRDDRTRIVRVGRLCELITSAAEKITGTPPPAATHLPVEPLRPFPSEPAAEGARRANPSVYRMSSSDFDVVFITPVQLMASQGRASANELPSDFSNWSEYVEATPPVLLIRVTPKLAEGFWTKVARGAAMTQGVSIPPIKRLKPDFASMRALCGDTEIVPVHPFKLEHRLTDTDTLVEGLYAFDPGALTPACTTVTLQLFSVKDPRKADSLAVDAKTIQRVWEDFAPYRAVK